MKPNLSEPNQTEVIYTAGMFDGEGCVNIYRKRSYGYRNGQRGLIIGIGSTYFPIIQKFQQDIWGLGCIVPDKTRGGNQAPYWNWAICANEALWILECIYPYLYIKKRQVELAILYQRWLSSRKNTGCRGKSEPEIQMEDDVFETMKYLHKKPPPQDGIKLPIFDTLRSLVDD